MDDLVAEAEASQAAHDSDHDSDTAEESAPVGRRLGSFRLQGLLGTGSTAQVFLAEHPRLERPVALKVARPGLQGVGAVALRWQEEARLLASLHHPHVVALVGLSQLPDGRPALALAYAQGETLRTRLARGPLPVEIALELLVRLSDAVGAVHAAGIAHRDVKPANVVVTPGPDGLLLPTLLDFGRAVRLERAQGGRLVGSPLYMSPEQIRREAADARADVYALGVIAYELLSGAPPFRGAAASVVMSQHLTRTPAPLTDVPERVASVVALALQKEREDRPADGRSLARLWREALASLHEPTVDPQLQLLLRCAARLPFDHYGFLGVACDASHPEVVQALKLHAEALHACARKAEAAALDLEPLEARLDEATRALRDPEARLRHDAERGNFRSVVQLLLAGIPRERMEALDRAFSKRFPERVRRLPGLRRALDILLRAKDRMRALDVYEEALRLDPLALDLQDGYWQLVGEQARLQRARSVPALPL